MISAGVTRGDVWSTWAFDPILVAGLALAGCAYGAGVAKLWRGRGRGRGLKLTQVVAFYSALLVLALALLSPLDALAEVFVSAHMVQHLALILIGAPLLVYGAPAMPMMLAMGRSIRRRLQRLERNRLWVLLTGALINAVVVWGLHALAMWAWHLPVLYEQALRSDAAHAFEHSSFLGSALLFWFIVMHPARRRSSLHGAAMFLVFATALQSGALGALLAFATNPLYPTQARAAEAWGTSALADQQLAGLIMWVPMGAIYAATMAILFVRWFKDMEQRAQAREVAAFSGAGDQT